VYNNYNTTHMPIHMHKRFCSFDCSIKINEKLELILSRSWKYIYITFSCIYIKPKHTGMRRYLGYKSVKKEKEKGMEYHIV
jgi:hypothetical protein